MEDNKNFTEMLFQAVLERQQVLDSYLLPKLHDEYRIIQSSAKTVRSILVKKAILHDDEYKYDSKITDIEVPSEEGYTDGERNAVIGHRLAQYEAMLEYLSNYYQFTCDFLTTDRINKLIGLGRCFSWEAFSNTSTRPNTKGLADLVNNIRNSSDSLSISILNDSLTQLSKSSLSVAKTLKGLTEFHRERYKTAVRKLVMPGVVIDAATLETGPSTAMHQIKKAFAASMAGQPFYTELIEEILKEDFSPDHAVRQQELLSRLASTKGEASKGPAKDSLKPVLLDGIRTIGAVSPQLDEIVAKLSENQRVVLATERSFFQKLAEALKKAFNIPEREEDIQILSVDPVTQTGKKEYIKFNPFIEDVKHRARVCTAFAVRTSPAYQKIELMDEQQILDLLTRHIADIATIMKQCAGLDEYFKQNTDITIRERMRGIKVEISAIRNNLVKANQCRAEYAAQVEEQQQLKKLGIING